MLFEEIIEIKHRDVEELLNDAKYIIYQLQITRLFINQYTTMSNLSLEHKKLFGKDINALYEAVKGLEDEFNNIIIQLTNIKL